MAATRSADTTPGVVLGTLSYMSPEQARGQAVDHRADLFSVAAILYEMLSGERPFGGDTPADTISAILRSDPYASPDGKRIVTAAGQPCRIEIRPRS